VGNYYLLPCEGEALSHSTLVTISLVAAAFTSGSQQECSKKFGIGRCTGLDVLIVTVSLVLTGEIA
jgi:hypothetical protein